MKKKSTEHSHVHDCSDIFQIQVVSPWFILHSRQWGGPHLPPAYLSFLTRMGEESRTYTPRVEWTFAAGPK